MTNKRAYKRAEIKLMKKVKGFFCSLAQAVTSFFVRVFNFGKRKMTVMIVPHTEQRSLNFQVSIFSLFFTTMICIGLLVSFVWLSTMVFTQTEKLVALKNEAKKTQASLDILQDQTSELLTKANNFKEVLSGTLTSLGLQSVMSEDSSLKENSDLVSLFEVKGSGTTAEISELKKLSNYLTDVVQPVQEMGKVLETQAAFVSDIPSLWPIKGGYGYVTMGFGQNRHPFTQQWYIHTGIDLATGYSGSPIVATADGQVVTVEYDSGWGNYVIIKHKHGFYTRYAHLQSYAVQRGQSVQQGQVIGYLGNTGISTGPHLHYEVHIGADIVDPAQYLNIKKR